MEVATALGGSFKLLTLAPKPVRKMTQLPKETQKDGDIQTDSENITTANLGGWYGIVEFNVPFDTA